MQIVIRINEIIFLSMVLNVYKINSFNISLLVQADNTFLFLSFENVLSKFH